MDINPPKIPDAEPRPRQGAARWIGLIAASFAAVYAMAYADLTLRARAAYMEGMKYLEWSREPALKRAYYDARLADEEKELRAELDRGRLASDEFDEKMELTRVRRDARVSESSLKYAFVWFQSGAELFSPPESRWALMSRQKMAEAEALWKKELDSEHVSYQESMFQ